MSILDILTVFSYIALCADVLFQIARIHKTKSARDVSLIGASIRFVAIVIILIKFLSLNDWPLIIGQLLVFTSFLIYIFLVLVYKYKKAE